MNTIIIDGNLTKDPEVKYTKNGKSIMSFTIANNDNFKKKDDGWETVPCFIDCTFWLDDNSDWTQKLHKGYYVSLIGVLKQDKWEKEGKPYTKICINVDMIKKFKAPKLKEQNGNHEQQFQDDIPF